MKRGAFVCGANALVAAGLAAGLAIGVIGEALADDLRNIPTAVIEREGIHDCQTILGDAGKQVRIQGSDVRRLAGTPVSMGGIEFIYEIDPETNPTAITAFKVLDPEGVPIVAALNLKTHVPNDQPMAQGGKKNKKDKQASSDTAAAPNTTPRTRAYLFGQGMFEYQNQPPLSAPAGEKIYWFYVCYGYPVEQATAGVDIPSCEDAFMSSTGIQVSCPTDNSATGTIVSFLNNSNSEGEFPAVREESCACPAFIEGQPVEGPVYVGCTEAGQPPIDGVPQCYEEGETGQISAIIEADSNPKKCTTVNGKRQCSKCLDNPFTAVDECQPE